MAAPAADALELLQIEECDAWYEYLACTQEQPEPRYSEVEVWAWSKLQARLRTITARRAKAAL
jgi:hypothetical protein